MLTAIMTLSMPGPMTATMAMASRIDGKASIMSTRRMTRVSVRPPRYPAARPRAVPRVREMPMQMPPMRKEMREPWITRLRMSRPNSSVPMGCSHDGGRRRW